VHQTGRRRCRACPATPDRAALDGVAVVPSGGRHDDFGGEPSAVVDQIGPIVVMSAWISALRVPGAAVQTEVPQ
jgi:hypothetical protein